MLEFICSSGRFSEVKGVALYKDMERLGITSRTWQSMWEHFRRQIAPTLDEGSGTKFNLTPEDREQLIYWAGKSATRKNKKKNGESSSDVEYIMSEFSDSDNEKSKAKKNRNADKSAQKKNSTEASKSAKTVPVPKSIAVRQVVFDDARPGCSRLNSNKNPAMDKSRSPNINTQGRYAEATPQTKNSTETPKSKARKSPKTTSLPTQQVVDDDARPGCSRDSVSFVSMSTQQRVDPDIINIPSSDSEDEAIIDNNSSNVVMSETADRVISITHNGVEKIYATKELHGNIPGARILKYTDFLDLYMLLKMRRYFHDLSKIKALQCERKQQQTKYNSERNRNPSNVPLHRLSTSYVSNITQNLAYTIAKQIKEDFENYFRKEQIAEFEERVDVENVESGADRTYVTSSTSNVDYQVERAHSEDSDITITEVADNGDYTKSTTSPENDCNFNLDECIPTSENNIVFKDDTIASSSITQIHSDNERESPGEDDIHEISTEVPESEQCETVDLSALDCQISLVDDGEVSIDKTTDKHPEDGVADMSPILERAQNLSCVRQQRYSEQFDRVSHISYDFLENISMMERQKLVVVYQSGNGNKVMIKNVDGSESTIAGDKVLMDKIADIELYLRNQNTSDHVVNVTDACNEQDEVTTRKRPQLEDTSDVEKRQKTSNEPSQASASTKINDMQDKTTMTEKQTPTIPSNEVLKLSFSPSKSPEILEDEADDDSDCNENLQSDSLSIPESYVNTSLNEQDLNTGTQKNHESSQELVSSSFKITIKNLSEEVPAPQLGDSQNNAASVSYMSQYLSCDLPTQPNNETDELSMKNADSQLLPNTDECIEPHIMEEPPLDIFFSSSESMCGYESM